MNTTFSPSKMIFGYILLFILMVIPVSKAFSQTDNYDYLPDDDEYNIVMASARGDYEMVREILKKGISANIVLEESISPLIYAAKSGSIRIAKLLVAEGADVDIKPKNGHTPLITAAKYHQYSMVDYLLMQGAKINLANDFGRTPLFYVASIGDSAMMTKLINANADINYADTTGCTPLMTAVGNNNNSIVKELLKAGCNPNTSDKKGVTPIMIAAANLNYDMVNVLLEAGANINALSKNKQTALTIAIEENDEAFVQFLLNNGADVNQKLNLAETPLTVAKYLDSEVFLVDNLKSKGAKQNIIPNFRTFVIGPTMTFNNNDFIPGINLGFKDYKFDLELTAGFMIRPFAPRILYKYKDEYYQFWERRYSFYVALDKYFLIHINKYKHRQGLFAGVKVHKTYSSFRGINYTPESNTIIAPELGYYYATKHFVSGINYAYLDFLRDGVAPHRAEVFFKFYIGRAFKFKKDLYKSWE